MFTVSKLIESIPCEGSLEIKKLEKILKLSKKIDRQRLEIAIKALNKLGIIDLQDEGKVKIINDDTLIKARLRCSSKGYCFAVRDDGEGEDIYIRDNFLNHAWNGDRVLVKISREAVRRRSPEGIVQCILERSTPNIISLLEEDEGNIIANPLDDRILSQIKLEKSDEIYYDKNKLENLVEIKIDRFPIAQYEAKGHVIRPLPLDAGIKGDIDILLTKTNLQNIESPPRSTIKSPQSKNRKDFTHQPALLLRSWSENDSPPLPAIHVEPNSGGIRLWVHVPSIAERVSLGNNLDQFLFQTSQAHCLGSFWHPLLSSNLTKASQFNVDKINQAITVELELDSQGEIIDWEFCLSEIKPVAEITDTHLKALESRKPKARTIPLTLKPIKDHLIQLETIIFFAKKLFELERSNGLIELDLSVPKIKDLKDILWEIPGNEYEQWKNPFDNSDPQSILAPIIRTANKAWYKHLTDLNLPGIIIKSDPIDNNTLNDLAKSALALNVELELNEDGILSASELANAFSKTDRRRVLDKLLRHALPNPKLYRYSRDKVVKSLDSNSNTTIQSHNIQAPWCCPTINYHDIINQHIQVTLLKEGKSRPSARHKTNIELGKMNSYKDVKWDILTEITIATLDRITSANIVRVLNSNLIKAKSLRYGLIAMAQARSAEPFIGMEMEAVISGVQSYGFFAEIKPFLAEGLVHVSTLNDDWYEYRSRQSRLVGRKSKRIYQLGEKLTVKIIKVDVLRNQIDLEVCELDQQNIGDNDSAKNNNESSNESLQVDIS